MDDDKVSVIGFAAAGVEILGLWRHEVVHEEVPRGSGVEQEREEEGEKRHERRGPSFTMRNISINTFFDFRIQKNSYLSDLQTLLYNWHGILTLR